MLHDGVFAGYGVKFYYETTESYECPGGVVPLCWGRPHRVVTRQRAVFDNQRLEALEGAYRALERREVGELQAMELQFGDGFEVQRKQSEEAGMNGLPVATLERNAVKIASDCRERIGHEIRATIGQEEVLRLSQVFARTRIPECSVH